MTQIIAGRFQTSEQTDQAVHALVARSVARDRISVFYVTPPGQHDATPVGGDDVESPGLERAERGAGTGAAIGVGAGVAGALIGATAGLAAPMVAIAGLGAAAAGAYSGAFAGAMHASMDPGADQIRHAGMMVAVDAGAVDATLDVAAALRDAGAVDIESAEGTWTDGTWEDFDPTRPPQLVDTTAPVSPAAASN
ncbi:MAG: hypothetical protein ABI277_05860 [Burkholderiaceae bacterium]